MSEAKRWSDELVAALESQRIVRIAFSAPNELYLVPLAYAWLDGSLYCVTVRGKKTEMARDNSHVAFQVDDSAEKGLLGWTSVTGQGEVSFVDEESIVSRIKPVLLQRFSDVSDSAARIYERKAAAGELVWLKISPTRMSLRVSEL